MKLTTFFTLTLAVYTSLQAQANPFEQDSIPIDYFDKLIVPKFDTDSFVQSIDSHEYFLWLKNEFLFGSGKEGGGTPPMPDATNIQFQLTSDLGLWTSPDWATVQSILRAFTAKELCFSVYVDDSGRGIIQAVGVTPDDISAKASELGVALPKNVGFYYAIHYGYCDARKSVSIGNAPASNLTSLLALGGDKKIKYGSPIYSAKSVACYQSRLNSKAETACFVENKLGYLTKIENQLALDAFNFITANKDILPLFSGLYVLNDVSCSSMETISPDGRGFMRIPTCDYLTAFKAPAPTPIPLKLSLMPLQQGVDYPFDSAQPINKKILAISGRSFSKRIMTDETVGLEKAQIGVDYPTDSPRSNGNFLVLVFPGKKGGVEHRLAVSLKVDDEIKWEFSLVNGDQEAINLRDILFIGKARAGKDFILGATKKIDTDLIVVEYLKNDIPVTITVW